ncbi:MAG: arylsulfatase [Cyclobacteriaceae bacterium]
MKLHKKSFPYLLILILLSISAFAQKKPNIVVILADDLGYASANCYGAPKSMVRTPHIDRLAEQGMRFTDANTPGSVCSPTRYALLTGRYAWRGSLKYGVLNPPEGALLIEDELKTLPAYLQDNGYQTAQVGKWHLGYTRLKNVDDLSAQPLTPGANTVGFDYHFGVPNNIDWLPKVYIENEQIWGLRSKGKSPYGKSSYKNRPYHGYDAPQRMITKVMDDITDKSREWIFKSVRQNPEKPFFLYFAPVAVHNPITPGERLRGSSGCGAYCDYIHDLDYSVGEIINALAYSNVLEETIIIFTSDNGGDIGNLIAEKNARELGFKNNGDLKGDKHTIWEGGFRVPFIVRWPGKVEAGTVSDRTINVVDIFATVQELVSGEVMPPLEAGADSFSFYDELIGERNEAAVRPHMVVNSVSGTMAVRKGPWKYIEGIATRKLNQGIRDYYAGEFSEQLYNLKDDISESNDLLESQPKEVKDLKNTLEQIRSLGSERLAAESTAGKKGKKK